MGTEFQTVDTTWSKQVSNPNRCFTSKHLTGVYSQGTDFSEDLSSVYITLCSADANVQQASHSPDGSDKKPMTRASWRVLYHISSMVRHRRLDIYDFLTGRAPPSLASCRQSFLGAELLTPQLLIFPFPLLLNISIRL